MAKQFFNLFGFSIIKDGGDEVATSVVTPDTEDGSIVTNQLAGHNVLGNTYMLAFDQDGQIRNEMDLIRRYREIARYPEISEAINDIVNEAIVVDDSENSLKLNLDGLKVSDALKRKILAEFDVVLSKLNFREEGHEIFEKWYVDGKIFIHIILDDNTKNGITELRFIDPRKIKKIKNLIKGTVQYGVDVIKEIQEYYLYNDKGIADSTTSGVRLSPDSIVYCHSGLIDTQTGLVQSHIHKAIRPANQLKMLEEAVVIYRYTRAPERRVFYIDVGNLPKGKAEQYVTDMMNKFKNKLQYDAVTGDVADSKRHLCLDMNTRVPLLDGRVLSISEISTEMEVTPEKKLWAYSCDPITGEFAPGLITWAGVARKDAQVMRLTLDNGETITCTPDHKFPVWNKGLVKAEDMLVGESLVPHYNKEEPVVPFEGASKYQQIFDNKNKKWIFTHRAVSDWKDVIGIDNTLVFAEDRVSKKTVHHIDINKWNNSPENLVRMNNLDHKALHKDISTRNGNAARDLGLGYFNREHPNYILWHTKAGKIGGVISSETGKSAENWQKGRSVFSQNMQDVDYKKWFTSRQVEGWTLNHREVASDHAKNRNLSKLGNDFKSEQYKDKNSQVSKNHKKKYTTEYPQELTSMIVEGVKLGMDKKTVLAHINSSVDIIQKFVELNKTKVMGGQKDYTKLNLCDIGRIMQATEYGSVANLKEALKFRNHKITKVEWLDERMDTGCLTIDGNEEFHKYHTFALASGVYTGNQMMEDFWMPRRGDKSTEITTLPGGQGLGDLSDLDYFKDKLYRSLNVPKSRFAQDTGFQIGRSDTVSRDEIKFQKFISKIRNKFQNIFLDILRVQLISRGVFTNKDWDQFKSEFRIEFNKDNHFTELKENEILNTRVQTALQLDPFVGKYISKAYIQKKIMKFTDLEIKDIQRQIELELASEPAPEDEGAAQAPTN